MLAELIESGFGNSEDLNCAEKILYGANQAYQLGLNKDALKLSAGFGGGMGIGDTCGALAASVMVLSLLFVKERAHESSKIKELTQKLFSNYRDEMGDINCTPLKAKHCHPEKKCYSVIFKAAQLLDKIILEHKNEIIKEKVAI
ncbi:C-GCAxxG-C-C family (seleno)protein [Anaerosinus gibii]|uniref:C-GCAxxG-C-C family (Seleno)protein n=1 Tax=Selenobaculum gibii TaxID=3054208 RepID=A0A9Y2ESR7_9FIRM|nr:C-GCAxxG-C-C family (seleno)protein [Selenobaculum gbiensis]WIW71253.1 C-GCAxxG-C-C family (seleno)protein [Selenobaculum gbiensis]